VNPPSDTPRPLRRRWLRTAGWLVPLLLVLAVVVGEATGWPLLRGPLQRQAAAAAGVPVAFDAPFRLRLLGAPQLQLGGLRVGAAQGVELPHLLQADQALLGWTWGDLWRWHRGAPLRIRVLQARALDLRLVRLADGRASWALGAERPRRDPAGGEAALPRFGRLQVDAGQVVVDDATTATVLQVDVAGGEGGAAAGYRATVRGRWQQLPLDLAVHTGAALPLLHDGGHDATPALPLRIEGTAGAARLWFDGRAAALLGARRLDGALRFAGPSLAAVGAPLGLTLPRTPAFELHGRLAHDAGVWSLQADRATIGRSRLAGEFNVDTRQQPPRLDGRLTGARLLLADLGPAVGTAGEGQGTATAPPPATSPGRVLPQRRFDLPSLRTMDADVAVAIEQLDLGTPQLAPLQAVRGRVLLQGGVLQLQGLQATAAGGRWTAETRLDGRRSTAQWNLALQVSGLDIAGWLRALQTPAGEQAPRSRSTAALQRERRSALQAGRRADAASAPAAADAAGAPVRAYLTGVLDGKLQLQGEGTSTAQILGALQGQAQLRLREGTLSHLVTEAAGLDLAQALGVLVRGDTPLPLRCARADLAVEGGVVRARRVVVDNRDSTLRIDGQVDLRNEALALRARSRPKDFSPFSLRAPVLVTGTLADPAVGLDGRALGARAAAAAALAVIAAPVAALLPFVDTGQDDNADPCADPASAPLPGRPASR
jgi:AsmA family protein